MDLLKGGSILRPPFWDGNNYGYWKACMRAFIKYMDEQAKKVILTSYTTLTKKDKSGNKVPKRELD